MDIALNCENTLYVAEISSLFTNKNTEFLIMDMKKILPLLMDENTPLMVGFSNETKTSCYIASVL